VTMRDIAYRGIYVLPYEAFQPDSEGVPPRIVVVITDLKHLDDAIVVEVFPATVARIWNDFLPYMASTGARPAVVRGNSYRSGVDLRHFCDTRNCWHGSREDSRLGGLRIQGTEDSLGVVVSYLSENSPLFAAGLGRGDRITAVNGTPTLNWSAFERAVSEAPDTLAFTTGHVDQSGAPIIVRPVRAAWER
jgi:membrane-associated protease RseP (regulator of RpoE activity)